MLRIGDPDLFAPLTEHVGMLAQLVGAREPSVTLGIRGTLGGEE